MNCRGMSVSRRNTIFTIARRTRKHSNQYASKMGWASLAIFSLASGFLTGKYKSETDVANKARSDFVKQYLNERGFRIIDALDHVAKRFHAAPAQVALAWLM